MKMLAKIQVLKKGNSFRVGLGLATLVATLILSGCAGADHRSSSSFQNWLNQNDWEIEGVIFMRDLNKVAQKHSIFEFAKFLTAKGVNLQGQGDAQFVYGDELVRACGPSCSIDDGLGLVLREFARMTTRR